MRLSIVVCILATLFYSCDSVEPSGVEELHDIVFSTQSSTRGTLISSSAELDSFGVYALNESAPATWFMEGVEVMRSGDGWEYSPQQTWPSGGYSTLQFFAYAPFTTSEDGITLEIDSTTDVPYIYYQSPSDVRSQVDLMVGRCEINSATGCVDVAFTHAFAALNFRVSGSDASCAESITVEGLISRGTLPMTLYEDEQVVWEVEQQRDSEYTIPLDQDDYTLFVIPQSPDPQTRLTLNTSSGSEEYEFDSATEWQAGEIYTYEIIAGQSVVELDGVENCYIINPNEACLYSFDAITRVNQFWESYSEGIDDDDEWYLELIWADFSDQGYITFTQSSESYGVGHEAARFSLNTTSHGNLLIGLKRVGASEYLWSWHLWLTDYDPSCDLYTLEGGDNSGKKVMGRNLGATSAQIDDTASYGLYYQWGRKDPFYLYGYNYINETLRDEGYTYKVHTASEGSLSKTVLYPATFYYNDFWEDGSDSNLWGGYNESASQNCSENDKTIYDPCPQGWRVPAGEDWSGCSDDCTEGTLQSTMPLAGYRYFLNYQYLAGQGSQGRYWSGSPAANIWWGLLTSSYYLSFESNFSSLDCDATSARALAYTVRAIMIEKE